MSETIRITVIGTGYLGLTHAVCMADMGHEVLAIDVDEEKIAKASRGEAPFFEPGLEPLLRKNLDSGRLGFTTSYAEVGEAAGAVIVQLAEALGYDERIGRKFLGPGLGFGGGCLPKDIRAFGVTAAGLGVTSMVSLLSTVDTINLGRRDKVMAMAREAVGGNLAGKRVAVLGVAFKPNSDDIRDSPSLDICQRLAAEGAVV